MRTRHLAVCAAALVLLVSACSGTTSPQSPPSRPPTQGSTSSSPPATTSATTKPTTNPTTQGTPSPSAAPLRPGEVMRRVSMPAAYRPKAPHGGTDDYRCFLLDPRVGADSFVTGYDVVPGDLSVVHHVILYRVASDKVPLAKAMDDRAPGDGWTCFGGTGIEQQGASLDDAPWVGAWAPGGTERLLEPDIGIPLEKGSRLILQVHYNLLHGSEPDRTAVDLRLSTSRRLAALETVLYPAPVELPCRTGRSGRLCDREAAIFDVGKRFGQQSSRTVAGLQLICTGGFEPKPGPTQSCTRRVEAPAVVRAAAGHMHLLGSSIRIELNAGTDRARTLLDIPQWDFDDQGSRPVPATPVKRGDRITVTCTHDQAWRDRLPALEGVPERYVVWGEGTTDEMCLGILGVTRG